MYHNSLDLELHARFMRERAMEEAERARRADAAWRAGGHGAGRRFRLPAAAHAIRACFISQPRDAAQLETERRVVDSDPESMASMPAGLDQRARLPQPSYPVASPYAGMVVIARGETNCVDRAGNSRNVKEC
jgi:hypothetical protein